MAETQAFVTLATTDAYSMGCLVVGKSLRRHGTSRKLVVMVSPSVSRTARLALEGVFDEVVIVDVLDSKDNAHLAWLGRPELGVTFTKLHCWTLTQYSKCVFLDADTLVLCNIDDLFEYEELSAAPDPGWPDCFNTGVFVFRPSLNTYTQILEHAAQHGSFDGGDQGLLNTFFSDWAVKDIRKHLPFVYNLTASTIYTYLPAFQQYGHHAKIVHFLGGTKPWHLPYDPQAANESSFRDSNKNFEQFMNLWWVEYYSQRQAQAKMDDKNENYKFVPQTQAQHITITPSPPLQDLSLDSLTIRTSERLEETKFVPQQTDCSPSQILKSSTEAQHTTITPSPPLQDFSLDSLTIRTSERPEETNILFDVMSAVETEEPLHVSPSSEHTEPDTVEDSAGASGEAEDQEHRRMWEAGHIDYMGKDAFDNIKKKLDLFLD